MLLLLALACAPKGNENIIVTGTLVDTDESSGAAVPGARLHTVNLFTEAVDSATTKTDGSFSIEAPAFDTFFFLAEADGYVPTSVIAQGGTSDAKARDGTVWIRSNEAHAAAVAPFLDCPGADAPGGVIEGEVRVYLGETVEDDDTHPLVTTAQAFAEGADGVIRSACYLDDAGVFDPSADRTGATGRFAIFGVAGGIASLQVSYTIEDTLQVDQLHSVLVQGDGVAPMYPAWVPLP